MFLRSDQLWAGFSGQSKQFWDEPLSSKGYGGKKLTFSLWWLSIHPFFGLRFWVSETVLGWCVFNWFALIDDDSICGYEHVIGFE